MPRTRLLVCCQEPLGARLRGPGIRATELARAAGAAVDVVVAAPAGGDVRFDAHDPSSLRTALRSADAVLSPPLWPRHVAALSRAGVAWFCDLYVPEPLETLEHFRSGRRVRRLMVALALDRLDDALDRAALLLCASERQRDLWTGSLLTSRGLPPQAYDADPTLDRRVAIVPFGVPVEPPGLDGHPLRDRFGIPPDAPVVLWNGGTWPWLDPLTAVDAVLAQPDAHLVFLGGSDERVPGGPRVHVNDGWVAYEDRGAWLSDADVVISTHFDHLETRFSFRTRLVDAFWAGLPVVCTEGDDLAARVVRDDLGAVAPPGDADALAAGLERVLANGPATYRSRVRAAAETLTWPAVARPLLAALEDLPSRPPRGRRPHVARLARTVAYRSARPVLDRTGLRDWPRVS